MRTARPKPLAESHHRLRLAAIRRGLHLKYAFLRCLLGPVAAARGLQLPAEDAQSSGIGRAYAIARRIGRAKVRGPAHRIKFPTVIALIADTFLLLRRVCWPPLDLRFRFWLAQQFFVSGLIKVTHWETALDLAAHEYPVSWMSPTAAAYTGAAIEVIAPIFLASGLLTRYAALALLTLSLVIQFSYQPFDSQLFWIALFGWYAVTGAGPISLDQVLRRGLADSALPWVPRIIRISEAVRERVSPTYLSTIRIWWELRYWPLHSAARILVCGCRSRLVGIGRRRPQPSPARSWCSDWPLAGSP